LNTRTCLAGALLGISALAGCGATGAGADAGTKAPLVEGVTEEVGVLDNTFRPAEVTVAAGTEVVWDNGGRNDHNVLPVEGDDWGVEADDFAPGDIYRHRFTEPGTYAYYCSLHGTTTSGMVGTIVVTG
jgi:plastocyanin